MSPRSHPCPRTRPTLAALALAVLLSPAAPPSPAAAAGYSIPWSSVAGGGVTFATGAGYRLGGTLAQKDAGTRTGGGYLLQDGFWGPHPTRVTGVAPADFHGTPYRLVDPSPNPFHDATEFGFALPEPATAALEVFDVSGQRVRTLARERFAAGDVRVRWDGTADDGRRARAGIYFVRLDAAGHRTVRRVVLLP